MGSTMTPKTVHLVWLSFVDASGWLGGCVIAAPSVMEAIAKTWLLGINPGGEVGLIEFDIAETAIPDVWPIDRLCHDKAVMEAMPPPGSWTVTEGTPV